MAIRAKVFLWWASQKNVCECKMCCSHSSRALSPHRIVNHGSTLRGLDAKILWRSRRSSRRENDSFSCRNILLVPRVVPCGVITAKSWIDVRRGLTIFLQIDLKHFMANFVAQHLRRRKLFEIDCGALGCELPPRSSDMHSKTLLAWFRIWI